MLNNSVIRIFTPRVCYSSIGDIKYVIDFNKNLERIIYTGVKPRDMSNRRYELFTIVNALEYVMQNIVDINTSTIKSNTVEIYTSCLYIFNVFKNKTINKWLLQAFLTNDGKYVENRDLWKKLLNFKQIFNIELIYIQARCVNVCKVGVLGNYDNVIKERLKI